MSLQLSRWFWVWRPLAAKAHQPTAALGISEFFWFLPQKCYCPTSKRDVQIKLRGLSHTEGNCGSTQGLGTSLCVHMCACVCAYMLVLEIKPTSHMLSTYFTPELCLHLGDQLGHSGIWCPLLNVKKLPSSASSWALMTDWSGSWAEFRVCILSAFSSWLSPRKASLWQRHTCKPLDSDIFFPQTHSATSRKIWKRKLLSCYKSWEYIREILLKNLQKKIICHKAEFRGKKNSGLEAAEDSEEGQEAAETAAQALWKGELRKRTQQGERLPPGGRLRTERVSRPERRLASKAQNEAGHGGHVCNPSTEEASGQCSEVLLQ